MVPGSNGPAALLQFLRHDEARDPRPKTQDPCARTGALEGLAEDFECSSCLGRPGRVAYEQKERTAASALCQTRARAYQKRR